MCSNNFITNPFGITAKAADPLNLSQGHGFDLANPVGGWKYKVSPLNDRLTPKPAEVKTQDPETAPGRNPGTTPLPIPQPSASGVNYGGLQITQ